MTFTSGVPRPAAAGRKPGTPNRATKAAQAKADELGIDPFVVLLYFAAGDTAALGLKPYVDGKGRHRDPMVPLDLRMQAAVAACRHLLPVMKSVEVSGPDGGPLEAMLSLGEDGLAKRRAELQEQLSEDDRFTTFMRRMDEEERSQHAADLEERVRYAVEGQRLVHSDR